MFDVTNSPHYKKDGSYTIFAGRDASVALAKMSFKPEDLDDTDISKLKSDHVDALNGWF